MRDQRRRPRRQDPRRRPQLPVPLDPPRPERPRGFPDEAPGGHVVIDVVVGDVDGAELPSRDDRMLVAGQFVDVVGKVHPSSSPQLAFISRDTAENERRNDSAGEEARTGVHLPGYSGKGTPVGGGGGGGGRAAVTEEAERGLSGETARTTRRRGFDRDGGSHRMFQQEDGDGEAGC